MHWAYLLNKTVLRMGWANSRLNHHVCVGLEWSSQPLELHVEFVWQLEHKTPLHSNVVHVYTYIVLCEVCMLTIQGSIDDIVRHTMVVASEPTAYFIPMCLLLLQLHDAGYDTTYVCVCVCVCFWLAALGEEQQQHTGVPQSH